MNQSARERSISSLRLSDGASCAPLSRYAQVLRAPLFKTQDSHDGTRFRVASIKDFPEIGYLPVPERTIVLSTAAPRASRYILRPYDVLVVTVGSVGHVTVVPEDCEDNWIPATNMYIVRFREDAARRARGLYTIFKSQGGQELLSGMARGRGIQIIPKKEFARIQVPEPTEALLETTEARWNEGVALYRESLDRLQQSRNVFASFDVDVSEPLAV